MDRAASVRGAGKGDFPLAQMERVSGAGLDQGYRLQRFDRRAGQDHCVCVSPGGDDSALGIGNGGNAAVAALDPRATGNFDKNRVFGCRFWVHKRLVTSPDPTGKSDKF